MGESVKTSLRNITNVFAPSCISHALLTGKYWNKIKIRTTFLADALYCWASRKQTLKANTKDYSKKKKRIPSTINLKKCKKCRLWRGGEVVKNNSLPLTLSIKRNSNAMLADSPSKAAFKSVKKSKKKFRHKNERRKNKKKKKNKIKRKRGRKFKKLNKRIKQKRKLLFSFTIVEFN